jgi:hypothetical protein
MKDGSTATNSCPHVKNSTDRKQVFLVVEMWRGN